jgi:hypothetical protein
MNDDPHKVKLESITWAEAREIMARRLAEEMRMNPENWVGEFTSEVMAAELLRRGWICTKQTGDMKNVPRSN